MKREELDKIVEQKVEEKTRKLRKENRRLKEEIAELRQDQLKEDGPETSKSNNKMDRRGFMKSLGVGAAGLGALALTPGASALDIRSDDLSFYNQASGGLQLEVDSNGDLDLQNNDLLGIGDIIPDGNYSKIGGLGMVGAVPTFDSGSESKPIGDSELNNEELTFEFDEYDSSFIIRFRDSSGNIQTASVNID